MTIRFGSTLAVACTALVLTGCERSAVAESSDEQNKPTTTQEAGTMASDVSKASYLLGYNQVERMSSASSGVIDMTAFAQGVTDAAAGNKSATDGMDEQVLINALNQAVEEKQLAAAGAVVAEGQAYMADFAKKPGVVTLESGMMYEVITAGSGDQKPTLDSEVTTHYHGTLTDGTVFDSSVNRGQPASFPVSGVIAGWTEALQLMSVGSKWRLVIPPNLAYGSRGSGGAIPPNSTLVFEVELLEIK